MDEEWEKKLVTEFPTFFRNHGGDPRITCMAWGCTCGEGWFPLLWMLCEKIREETRRDPSTDFRFEQIKEKFGLLRIYASGGNQKISDLIHETEEDSAGVCEQCGSTDGAEPGPTATGWIKTLCRACREPKKDGVIVNDAGKTEIWHNGKRTGVQG